MHLIALKFVIGLMVGFLVGLTGLGGGVLLLPLLIFGLGVSPIIAVGSDAFFNACTKLGAAVMHWRQRTVNWYLVGALLVGSVPGALLGVAVLAQLRSAYGSGVNDFVRSATGLLLVIVPTLLLVQGQLGPAEGELHSPQARFPWRVAAIGFLAGILVGMTSIGSGSITIMLLMLISPYAPVLIVGTDVVHAVVLTGFTSLLHLHLGTVDAPLVAYLLTGSVPGALLGTRLSGRIPGNWLKRILCGVLFMTGMHMLLV